MTLAMPLSITSAQPIGFIGLGAMGAPMARRLAGLGWNVLVHDVNEQAVQSVVACGGHAVESARDMACQARLVMTCLPSLEVLRKVVLGADGLHEGTAIEAYVDFSTTGAQFARDMAQALRQRGIQMLDSPITGNVTTAGNGQLGIMCAGPLPAFELAKPVMDALAGLAVLYLGAQSGKAQTLKLLNNLLSATGMAASCEAFILGAKAGLDPLVMLDIINAGEASSSATRNKFARSVLPRRFDFGARMAITAKDTSLTVKESEDLGVPMWIGQAVQQVWKFAASQGGAERDGTSLITYLEPLAGIEVRLPPAPPAAAAPDHEPAHPAIERYLIVCEPAVRDVLAARTQGWPHCQVVAPAEGQDGAELILSPHAAGGGRRAVVNACLMPSTRAAGIAAQLARRGDDCIDALLTGTAAEIASGAAAVLVSGAAAAVDAARPLLEAMGGRVFVVSARPGAAQTMQQINGALAATLLGATCEAFVAGARAGLDPLTMTKILGLETGRNVFSARVIPGQVATRAFGHGRPLGQPARELQLLADEAHRLGVTPWILDKARLLYALAARLGSPQDDVTRLITHYERWAGVQVKAQDNP